MAVIQLDNRNNPDRFNDTLGQDDVRVEVGPDWAHIQAKKGLKITVVEAAKFPRHCHNDSIVTDLRFGESWAGATNHPTQPWASVNRKHNWQISILEARIRILEMDYQNLEKSNRSLDKSYDECGVEIKKWKDRYYCSETARKRQKGQISILETRIRVLERKIKDANDIITCIKRTDCDRVIDLQQELIAMDKELCRLRSAKYANECESAALKVASPQDTVTRHAYERVSDEKNQLIQTVRGIRTTVKDLYACRKVAEAKIEKLEKELMSTGDCVISEHKRAVDELKNNNKLQWELKLAEKCLNMYKKTIQRYQSEKHLQPAHSIIQAVHKNLIWIEKFFSDSSRLNANAKIAHTKVCNSLADTSEWTNNN